MTKRTQLLRGLAGKLLLLSLPLTIATAQQAPTPDSRPLSPSEQAPAPSEEVTSGASKRNEKVYIKRIDTGVLKDLNVRLGDSVTIIDPSPDRSYYATEHGRAPSEVLYFRPSRLTQW